MEILTENYDLLYLTHSRKDGWISVSDRLPKKPYKVLAYLPTFGSLYIAFYMDGYWQIDYNGHFIEPTHWMEIPVLPKN